MRFEDYLALAEVGTEAEFLENVDIRSVYWRAMGQNRWEHYGCEVGGVLRCLKCGIELGAHDSGGGLDGCPVGDGCPIADAIPVPLLEAVDRLWDRVMRMRVGSYAMVGQTDEYLAILAPLASARTRLVVFACSLADVDSVPVSSLPANMQGDVYKSFVWDTGEKSGL
jgi:hypothetical protein